MKWNIENAGTEKLKQSKRELTQMTQSEEDTESTEGEKDINGLNTGKSQIGGPQTWREAKTSSVEPLLHCSEGK